jgi:hypothetical protein
MILRGLQNKLIIQLLNYTVKKGTCIFFILLLTGSVLFAQPAIQFQKFLADLFPSVALTSDGGFITMDKCRVSMGQRIS